MTSRPRGVDAGAPQEPERVNVEPMTRVVNAGVSLATDSSCPMVEGTCPEDGR